MDKMKLNLAMKLIDYFQSPLLDDIYETRTNGILGILLKEFKNEEGECSDIQKEMEDIIKEVPNEKVREQLLTKLEKLEQSWLNEENYLVKEYYKFGLTDSLQWALETGYRNSILKRGGEIISILKMKIKVILEKNNIKKTLKHFWKNLKKNE